ncbi:MAG: cell division protein ZapE [Phenylobacterium sp.]
MVTFFVPTRDPPVNTKPPFYGGNPLITQYYQQALQQPDFDPDPVQAEVVKILQRSFDLLPDSDPNPNKANITSQPPSPPISLYLWGKVGRGKSFLMDAFYHCLDQNPCYNSAFKGSKRRVHFYRFMQDVHRRLAEHQGKTDPLIDVANEIAKQSRILCFDEFFVSDIADAMLLSGLIHQLFKQGVIIIATSNVEPARLYEDGLQRPRFLPAIALIEANMQVVEMDGLVDHRLRSLAQSNAYFMFEDDSDGEKAMHQHFLANGVEPGGDVESDSSILIEHRQIPCVYKTTKAIWFEFDALCKGPRSQNDYIALANQYSCVYIANVPQMGGALTDRNIAQGTEDASIGHGGASGSELAQLNIERQRMLVSESKSDDEARRFISLVDEFYDQQVALYLSATVEIVALYLGGRVSVEFERTTSRLIEMQSQAYLKPT